MRVRPPAQLFWQLLRLQGEPSAALPCLAALPGRQPPLRRSGATAALLAEGSRCAALTRHPVVALPLPRSAPPTSGWCLRCPGAPPPTTTQRSRPRRVSFGGRARASRRGRRAPCRAPRLLATDICTNLYTMRYSSLQGALQPVDLVPHLHCLSTHPFHTRLQPFYILFAPHLCPVIVPAPSLIPPIFDSSHLCIHSE